ncbi:GDSL-type esterase/lipase family protein [Pseudonocardia sp. RS11V-5]|uniref:GDSL-type esterase/lipase family protein n=1 Tax=Pseudonocardia terrae TaxID=2905831 RepID=UPI001E44EAC9|nr:GDSL-type esterase/lipase family protein [Pseudonocardia terrae]MCE3554031.1 GDSL-type esterase/lipase family protein [Pseudonocardia terrae]
MDALHRFRGGRGLAAGLVAAAAVLGLAVALLPFGSTGASGAEDGASPAPCGPAWVAAWRTSPQAGQAFDLGGRTLRMLLRPQATGSELRIRVSNRFGTQPLRIDAASAAVAGSGAALVPGTARPVLFAGAPTAVVPPGQDLTSDPLAFVAQRGTPLAISLFLPQEPDRVAVHPVALQTSYVSTPGDVADSVAPGPFTRAVSSWFVLTGVDVLAPRAENAVVLVGESITDGVASDPDRDDRWSDALAGRLTGGLAMPVLNAGISANQLLGGGTGEAPAARYADDVASVPGAADVVLHIGTNDLAAGRDAGEIVAGLVDYADRVRADGRRVFLTTITPSTAGAHGTPFAVEQREAVNRWIRTEGPAHADGVFDFATAVADPADAARLAPAFDSGDGLHLSAAGYRALAMAVDPTRLTGSPCLADGDAAKVLVSAPR